MESIRDKSIFDFCEDPEVLKEYVVEYDSKEAYLEALKVMPDREADAYRIMAILEYAEDSGDKELQNAIRDQCADIIDGFFNE